jgi:hypothetical protein
MRIYLCFIQSSKKKSCPTNLTDEQWELFIGFSEAHTIPSVSNNLNKMSIMDNKP